MDSFLFPPTWPVSSTYQAWFNQPTKCNPYANQNFVLNMNRLQWIPFLGVEVFHINCINIKQEKGTMKEKNRLCLIFRHTGKGNHRKGIRSEVQSSPFKVSRSS